VNYVRGSKYNTHECMSNMGAHNTGLILKCKDINQVSGGGNLYNLVSCTRSDFFAFDNEQKDLLPSTKCIHTRDILKAKKETGAMCTFQIFNYQLMYFNIKVFTSPAKFM
jgi:hypothetical protein